MVLTEDGQRIELGLGIIAEKDHHLDRQAQPATVGPQPETVHDPRHALLTQDLQKPSIAQCQQQGEIRDLQADPFALHHTVGRPFGDELAGNSEDGQIDVHTAGKPLGEVPADCLTERQDEIGLKAF
jgi:hypothetical protein